MTGRQTEFRRMGRPRRYQSPRAGRAGLSWPWLVIPALAGWFLPIYAPVAAVLTIVWAWVRERERRRAFIVAALVMAAGSALHLLLALPLRAELAP